ncbi:MAG TPA: NAD-dependent dihydropyrimidine dehydrogenase subunit PreA [Gemmatimonadales bacterium]|jgi:dihydropyrimidine dehydrogenase (NAD+) subunit PreA|nr:NAD-dependent dihydropyrimidine dehydrogenase subunit PreA [Gemmatimonadales bacterium]
MADLKTNFAGIESPNPFWLASGPPTNTYGQVAKAFDQGWGGAVWKTIGDPIINVFSRYGSVDLGATRMMGFNNIELISDRPIADNLKEIAEVKRNYPKHAIIASLMVESKRDTWHDIVKRTQDTGADGIELNFGCPHGMSERGMGSAVGQVPDYTCQIVEWVKEVATIPVIVKLTPNVTDVTYIARAAVKGGADALSLINTINSIVTVDLDTFAPAPSVGGKSSHGGYCGPAVKPIALHLVSAVAKDPQVKIPISGIGGISTWRDAAEFIALGAGSLQVCTAVMHYGFRIVEDLIDGLSNWMDEKGHRTLADVRGRALPNVMKWEDLDLNYHLLAHIDQEKCIKCELCWTACEDGAHQAIRRLPRDNGGPVVEIIEEACVGCNLCAAVCPVHDCITMQQVPNDSPPTSWKDYLAGKGKLAARSEQFHTADWASTRK